MKLSPHFKYDDHAADIQPCMVENLTLVFEELEGGGYDCQGIIFSGIPKTIRIMGRSFELQDVDAIDETHDVAMYDRVDK